MGWIENGRFGLEVMFRRINLAGVMTLTLTKAVNGVGRYSANLNYDPSVGTWSIPVAGGQTVTVFDWSWMGSQPVGWIIAKLVIDTNDLTLWRAIIGDNGADLNQYSLERQEDAEGESLRITIGGYPLAGYTSAMYIGHVIVTRDEP